MKKIIITIQTQFWLLEILQYIKEFCLTRMLLKVITLAGTMIIKVLVTLYINGYLNIAASCTTASSHI